MVVQEPESETMSFYPAQFRDLIYRSLKAADLPRKDAAIDLLMGTAAHESLLGTYLKQTVGPALGVYQMEPATAEDVIEWTKEKYPGLFERLGYDPPEIVAMEYDLRFATIMARLNYLRMPGSIPETVVGQAGYWKKYWNTSLGKGTVAQYIKNWQRYVD